MILWDCQHNFIVKRPDHMPSVFISFTKHQTQSPPHETKLSLDYRSVLAQGWSLFVKHAIVFVATTISTNTLLKYLGHTLLMPSKPP